MKYKTFKCFLEAILEEMDYNTAINNVHNEFNNDTFHVLGLDSMYVAHSMIFTDEFGGKNKELIDWWLYDSVDKFIYDKNNEVIANLTDIEDLWEYLNENRD